MSKHDDDDALRHFLAERALRATGARLAVLRTLASLARPASHAELAAHLANDGIERTTVYRNLVALADAGVLVRTQLGDAVWRFELPKTTSASHGNHPHFVCTTCGAVACLAIASITLRDAAARNQIHEGPLLGRCGECSV